MSFFADEFWAAFADAGMLVECTWMQPGGDVPATVLVRRLEPDVTTMMHHVASKEYAIEYRTADMPTLKEGDLLSLAEPDGSKADYRVREDPTVRGDPGSPQGSGTDGTYRWASLTRVEDQPT